MKALPPAVVLESLSPFCSLSLDDHRDPFDRTILAEAMARSLPILTRDRWMAARYPRCIW